MASSQKNTDVLNTQSCSITIAPGVSLFLLSQARTHGPALRVPSREAPVPPLPASEGAGTKRKEGRMNMSSL